MTKRIPAALYLALLLLGVVLTVTAVPGQFTVDEASYTVTVTGLRAGRFTVPGTEDLTPSLELAFFDPAVKSRANARSPIGSTAPPLYAFMALPFSFLGWKGLIALQTLSFLGTALLVFWLARRYASKPETPWIAVATYVLGGYSIEYAQGVWPHALSAFLCTAGFCLFSVARDEGRDWLFLCSGFVLAAATGVRYQNILFAFGVGLALLLFSQRRVMAAIFFNAGCAVPLLASSVINHIRLDSWNPISKGAGYFSIETSAGKPRDLFEAFFQAGHVLFAKIVDYSIHPVPSDPAISIDTWMNRDPQTGVVVFYGALKKAWLQSSPWLALALVVLALSWRPRAGADDGPRPKRDLRSFAIVFAVVLGAFGVAGFDRHDGLCFNQRYFLELVPMGAIAVAWALERRPSPSVR